jgi:ParB-like chromosome segregation protein Spo0J
MTGAKMAKPKTPPAPSINLFDPAFIVLRTNNLMLDDRTQIRADTNLDLVAEYAQAMLEGAVFPPIVVFEDADGGYHVGDGYHRIAAVHLAAASNNKFKAEINAVVREGGENDAILFALEANRAHGKRLDDDDYKHAYAMLVDRGLIGAVWAKDVVPNVVAKLGCSIRRAQELSTPLRLELRKKRDRIIVRMTDEGRTQEDIARELEVTHQTVSNVLAAFAKKRDGAFSGKGPKRPKPPNPFREDEEAKKKAAEDAKRPAEAQTEAEPSEAANPELAVEVTVKSWLPALDKLKPEKEEDIEVGAVGMIEEAPEKAPEPDEWTLQGCQRIETAVDQLRQSLRDLPTTTGGYKATRDTIAKIAKANRFLAELMSYLQG